MFRFAGQQFQSRQDLDQALCTYLSDRINPRFHKAKFKADHGAIRELRDYLKTVREVEDLDTIFISRGKDGFVLTLQSRVIIEIDKHRSTGYQFQGLSYSKWADVEPIFKKFLRKYTPRMPCFAGPSRCISMEHHQADDFVVFVQSYGQGSSGTVGDLDWVHVTRKDQRFHIYGFRRTMMNLVNS
ncbi:hypothetical protein [Pseudobacteriovorax antillogorgiicola]|uniref:Uncharacterized protein n=1 Tax=Pseudobacteriovorax antillogorgiicola TaxID=1513793 RepID=A0A1Y6BSP2_9BACT|nr:hypothetical protein [Pseudobacteriovorax antillogorgiicola]TCS53046.1 hypothetical protein EDD56_10897 [Pseudobacteriovorax antillogorgiicola]SMF26443.1 hypothetical protein SAMN06296036_108150 [Pseudobacteriovorax antillogorgiicola]